MWDECILQKEASSSIEKPINNNEINISTSTTNLMNDTAYILKIIAGSVAIYLGMKLITTVKAKFN